MPKLPKNQRQRDQAERKAISAKRREEAQQIEGIGIVGKLSDKPPVKVKSKAKRLIAG